MKLYIEIKTINGVSKRNETEPNQNLRFVVLCGAVCLMNCGIRGCRISNKMENPEYLTMYKIKRADKTDEHDWRCNNT